MVISQFPDKIPETLRFNIYRTETHSHFAVLEKEDYCKIVKRKQQKDQQRKIEFLLTLPVFQKLSKDHLNRLSQWTTELEFKRGHLVDKNSDSSDKMYIVQEGEFEATQKVTFQDFSEEEWTLIQNCLSNQATNESIKVQVIHNNNH